MDELNATIGWFAKSSSQVSAHSVAGPWTIARCVLPANTAWHARSWNGTRLGLEIVQCFLGDPLDHTAVDAAAWECANWVKDYNIPIVHDINNGFCQHFEIPPGVEDGKTDIEYPFDMTSFLNLVKMYRQMLG